MKIGILTDSCSGLTPELFLNSDVAVEIVPLSVIVNGQAYKENLEITNKEVQEYLLKEYDLGSSQPTVYDILESYKKLKEAGCTHIIALHLSGKLSGTYNNSLSSSQEFSDLVIEVIDSRIGSAILGNYVTYAVEGVKSGMSFDEIVSNIKGFIEKQCIYVCPYNLNQVRKSGRVSAMQNLFTSMLNIKIVLNLNGSDGTLAVVEKIRSEKKMLKYLEDKIVEAINKGVSDFYILQVSNEEKVLSWKSELEAKYPEVSFTTKDLIPIVSVHCGIGTIGIGFDGNY